MGTPGGAEARPERLSATLRDLLDQGRRDDARAMLRAWRGDASEDAAEHRAVAEIAEEVGEVALAITAYNWSLRDDRDQPGVILRLARLRADMGDMDRAVRAYRKYLESRPDDEEVRREAAGFLADSGRADLAAGFLGTQAPVVEEAPGGEAASDPPLPSEIVPGTARPGRLTHDPVLVPSDADCVTFATLFAGREGVHARQWASATGRTGYSPVREPFTPAVARQHLVGTYTVGIYPVRMDNTVLFAALDIDVGPSSFRPSRDEGRAFQDRLRRAHEASLKAVDRAASLDLPVLLEDSGHKGRHVWVLFERPVPAAAARRLATTLATAAEGRDAEVTVEVFPKQSRVAEGGLGNLIKLPLGIHRLTGRRGYLLDPASGRPLERPLDVLAEYPRVSREHLARILEEQEAGIRSERPSLRMVRPEPDPLQEASDSRTSCRPASAGDPEDGHPEEIRPWAPATAPLPEQEPYDPSRDLEVLTLLERCPVLREVVRRVEEGGILPTDERVVLTHTLGHLARGPDAVNAYLSRALNVDPSLFLKSRLRGQPASCPRIRSRLPAITAAVPCACSFDPGAGLYPTPLLHLAELRASGRYPCDPVRVTRLQAERMVTDLMNARAQASRAAALAREIEARLMAVMEEQRLDRIDVFRGTIRRGPDGLALEMAVPEGKVPEEGPCPSST